MSKTCKICKKPVVPDHKPFCSKRCADIDLGRWLKGGYVIRGRDGEEHISANDNPDADPELK
ncbi:MAG: DNA gyrase inhibitor YacG [Robiginitomaculum sp.]